MEEILARIEILSNKADIDFNNQNWIDSISASNEIIRLHVELKSIMKDQWLPLHQNNLASAYINLGVTQQYAGQQAVALASFQSAIEVRESLRQDFEDRETKWPPKYQNRLAKDYVALGMVQQSAGLLAAAQASYQSAIEIQELLRQDFEQREAKWPPEYQNDLADVYTHLGNAQSHSGQLEAEYASYQSAIELRESLRQDFEQRETKWPPKYQDDLAGAYINLGTVQQNAGLLTAAQTSYLSAIQLQESLRQDFEECEAKWLPKYQNGLATAYMNLAIAQSDSGQQAAAQASFLSAIQLQESLRQDFEQREVKWPSEYQNCLAKDYIGLAMVQQSAGLFAAAQASYQSAIEIQELLRQDFEQCEVKWPSEYQDDLAGAYINLGTAQQIAGLLAAAQTSYLSAIQLLESLRQDFEQREAKWLPKYQNSLAGAYMNLGNVHRDSGQLAAAQASYLSAIRLRESLRQDFEAHKTKWPLQYQNDLAAAYINLAANQQETGLLAATQASYQSAIEIQESLRHYFEEREAKWPLEYQDNLASAYMNLGVTQRDSGQLAAAQAAYQSAIQLQESLRQDFEARKEKWPPAYQNSLAKAYINLGVTQRDSGQLAAAQASDLSAIQLQESQRQDFEARKEKWPPEYQANLASAYMNLGGVQRYAGQQAAAQVSFQSAIQLQESLRQEFKARNAKWLPEYENDLAAAYLNLGSLQIESGLLAAGYYSYQAAFQCFEAIRLQMDKHWLLAYQQRFFFVLGYHIKLADSLPPEMPLHTILNITTSHLELYPTQSKDATQLLFALLRSYLKNSQYNSAIQVLSVLQGRELFNRLQKAQNESIDSPVLHAYFHTQSAFKQAIEQYAVINNAAAKAAKEAEIEHLRQAFDHARLALAADPAFEFMLTPFEFSISELQHNLTSDAARLIWLDLPDIDSSVSIQGVLAIPSSGTDVVWVDLTASDIKPAITLLTRLLAFQTPDARFYVSTSSMDDFNLTSYCQTHQQALGLSDDDIQPLTSRNEDNNEYGVDLSRDWVNKLLAKTWSQIMLMQTDIWQATELADWLARHEIRKIYHLSHGQSHNKPLTLGSAPHLEHNVLPNLSLLRLRQHITDSSFTEHQYDGFTQIISCPGELDEQQLIPFTALEAEVVTLSLPEQSNARVVSPTREITTLENQFPKHNNPLSFLHISCHGEQQADGLTRLLLSTAGSSAEIKTHDLWQIAPENTIGFSMINACIGGIVLDNSEGNPQGLVVPLLARSRNVISSLLPVNDIVATVFSALFYHFIQSNQTVEQAFYKTKQHIIDGDISEGVLERLMRVMKPIFQLEHLGQLISRLQYQLFEPTCDTYLLHCLAAIVPNIKEAEKISAKNGITLAEYLEIEFRSRMKLTHVPPVMREIAMAGYQLYG